MEMVPMKAAQGAEQGPRFIAVFCRSWFGTTVCLRGCAGLVYRVRIGESLTQIIFVCYQNMLSRSQIERGNKKKAQMQGQARSRRAWHGDPLQQSVCGAGVCHRKAVGFLLCN